MQVSHVDERVTHAVIGGRKTIDFDISNSAEFFHILSSTLYTDQRLAVVREVVCNAWDAHISSGRTNLPIEITIKDNQIMIRDFGNGIADEDMGHIYGTYGNSTKQNDGKQTGGFGLGCKAPFAYTDHFQVVSHHKGTKTIYALSKSSAVVGGKPGITPIVSMPTDDFGLSVSIPIKNTADSQYFLQKLKDLVFFGDIFASFNGAVLPRINFNTDNGQFYVFSSKLTQHSLSVRYGNVIYPVGHCTELGDLQRTMQAIVYDIKSVSRNYGLLLQAPPNSISVTPSRESLSMQENTIATLKDLMNRFISEFSSKAICDARLQIVKDSFKNPVIDKMVNESFAREIHSAFYKTEIKDTLSSVYEATQSTMQALYPHDASVRLLEVEERINLLMRLGKVSKNLGVTFLKAYKEDLKHNFNNIFARHYYGSVRGNNDWFFKVYAKSLIRKFQSSSLDMDRLYISDNRQINSSLAKADSLYKFTSAKFISINDCFPYLRNIVVLNTSRGAVKDEYNISDGSNSVIRGSGFLFYHVGMKKGDEQTAVDFWQSTGMTVINKCGTNVKTVSSSKPKKIKPDGYPLLSNVWHKERINTKRLELDSVTYTETPAFYVAASTRNDSCNFINGFHEAGLFFKYFGSKGVIITNTRTEENLRKKGIPFFGDYAAKEIAAHLTGNAAVFKHAALSHERVYQGFRGMNHDKCSCARQILATPTLLEYFKLNSSLSEIDNDYLTMLYAVNQSFRLSEDNAKTLSGLVESLNKVAPAQEVQDFLKEIENNPVVEFIDIVVFQHRFAEAGDDQTKGLLLDLFKTMFYL